MQEKIAADFFENNEGISLERLSLLKVLKQKISQKVKISLTDCREYNLNQDRAEDSILFDFNGVFKGFSEGININSFSEAEKYHQELINEGKIFRAIRFGTLVCSVANTCRVKEKFRIPWLERISVGSRVVD